MESQDRIGRVVAAILGAGGRPGVPCPMQAPCRIPVLKIRGPDRRHMVILSEDVWGHWCHYWRGQTYHCPGAPAGCAFCGPQGVPRQWQGWLAVAPLALTGWVVNLVAVTKETCRRVPPLHDGTLTLRGHVLSLWREGKAPPGALVGALDDVGHALPGLPPVCPDVANEVCRMSAAKVLKHAPPPVPAPLAPWQERLRREDEERHKRGRG